MTIELNDLRNVVLTHAALDSDGGTGLLQTSSSLGVSLGGGSRLILDPASGGGQTHEPVELVAVDQSVPSDRRVAVLQLDVEGHESEALAGAMRTIERCRPLILLETLPDASWIAEHLAPWGYEQRGWIEQNAIMRVRDGA